MQIKKVLLFMMILALSCSIDSRHSIAADPPDTEWDKTLPGLSTYEEPNFGIQTTDGGYLVVGVTRTSYLDSTRDIYILKTDGSGVKEWDKTLGDTDDDGANSVLQTDDGGYLVAGFTKSYGAGGYDFWIIKTDSTGTKEWDKTYGGTDDDGARSVIQTGDGGYIVAGFTKSYGAGDNDGWIIKIDSAGNKEWDKTYGGTSSDSVSAVIASIAGGYLFVGKQSRNGWIVKVDAAGNQVWEQTFDYGSTPNTDCNLSEVQQTVDGGYILAGSAYDAGQELTNSADVWLIKTDSSGNTEWNKLLNGGNYEWARSIQQTSDGGYFITCDANLRIWAVETDSTGNIEWSKFFDGSGNESGRFGLLTSDGGYFVGGIADMGNHFDFWLIKLGGTPQPQLFTLSGQEFSEVDFQAFDSEMGDVDGDGDLDVVFSGANGTAAARVYLNNGSGNFTDSGQAIGSGNAHDLLIRDFDNDGDLDLVLCVGGNLKIYPNNGSGIFTDSGQSLATNDNYMLAAADLDNDGDVDFIAATESNNNAHFYLNDGQGVFSDGGSIAANYCHEPAIADVDGDGDLDVGFAMNFYPTLIFFNDGNADFLSSSQVSGNYPTQGGVYFSDLDGDGDLDLFEANCSGYSSKLFWNDGSGSFTDSAQDFGGHLSDVTKVGIGDIDNDGDLDLLAESFYLNDGSGQLSKGDNLFGGQHVSMGDVDSDGDLDAISGKSLFLNSTADTKANTAPIQPTGLQAVRNGTAITFSWAAGTDSETPTKLLAYNMKIGTTAGGNDIFSGTMPTGSGNVGYSLTWTIKGLSADSYYWSVQTLDSAFKSSSWSSAQFAAVANSSPIGGYNGDNTIPTAQISQSTDGNGIVTINFRIKDTESDSCTLLSFEYSVDGGATWNAPQNGDSSEALSTGWSNNGENNYTSAADWSGTVHSFTFNTKHADVSGFTDADQNDVKVRFTINDGSSDSNSPVTSENFRVDNLNPSGQIGLNSGATYCTSRNVTITLNSADTASMCFSNDNSSFSGWEAYASSKSWTVPDGDGTKTMYVKYKDEAGNISTAVSDTIILDTTAPSGSVTINDGATHCNSLNISLSLTSSDAAYMCFSNDNISYSAWENYAASKSLTLSEGDGTKYVYVKYKDAVGNIATVSDSIILDSAGPLGPIVIDSGATYCTSCDVTITLNSSDADYMCFSNDNTSFSNWEDYAASRSWTLPEGDGTKYVYVKYKDEAGNIGTASSSIILDTIAPDLPVLINIEDTTENEPTFDWENVSGASYYIVQYADNPDFSSPITVESIAPSDYTAASALDDGTWYWRVCAVDAAGNASEWSSTGLFTVDTADYCESVPEKPVLLSPADEATNVSRTPALTTSAFADPENCSTHWKTRWQISEHEDFHGLTLNANTFDNLTTFEVAKTMLKPNTIYYWRVKYWGSHGNKSEWSDIYSFTTEAVVDDTNDNGIPDDQEVDNSVDLDGDGTHDNDQVDEIKSIKEKKGNTNIGVRPQDGQITAAEWLDDDAVSSHGNKPKDVPYGLISFRLEVPNYGDTATVKIYLSKAAHKDARWMKYDAVDGWQDYSDHAQFNEDRDQVTLTLKDGGYGDNDHTENGVIVDPSGLGIPDSSSTSGSSSGSSSSGDCFIATAAYGSVMQPHVKILREFRDRFLLNNSMGKAFMCLYYTYSPPLADFIAQNANLRVITRLSLLPIVGMSWVAIKLGLFSTLAMTFFLISGIMYFLIFRKKLTKQID